MIADAGQSCGAVGRAAASDTRDPRFDSQYFPILLVACMGRHQYIKKKLTIAFFKVSTLNTSGNKISKYPYN